MTDYMNPLNPYGDMPEIPTKDDNEKDDIKQKQMKDAMRSAVASLIGIIICLLLCWLFSGCTTTRVVTVPEVHEHWHHQTDTILKTDSIIDRQTTTIREVDSATMAQYGITLRDMQRAWLIETDRLQRELSELRQTKTDTALQRDSIPYPVEVVKEVPAKLSKTQKGLMGTGLLAIMAAIVFIVFKIKKFLP